MHQRASQLVRYVTLEDVGDLPDDPDQYSKVHNGEYEANECATDAIKEIASVVMVELLLIRHPEGLKGGSITL